MDTDDLSEDAYEAVILEAEKFHHDLTLQFGLLSENCSDEDEFLAKCMALISDLRQLKHDNLADIFFDDVPNVSDLAKALDRIEENIDDVTRIPIEKRRFDP